MNRAINKYNALAFYTEALEDHERCPLYSPHNRLPGWQCEFNTSEVSGGGATAKIIDANGNDVQNLTISTANTSDGKSYIDYKNTSVSPTLDEGVYRVKLTTNDDTYYSHPICVSQAYQTFGFNLVRSCTEPSGGGYQFTLLSLTNNPNMERAITVDFGGGNGYEWIGTVSGSFDQDDVVGSGDVTLNARYNVWYPDGSHFYKQYELAFNTSTPCSGSSLTQTGTGGRDYDNYCYLEFWNSKTLSDLGLFYQTGYKQRVYFHAAFSYPVAVTEETFLRNGENLQVLETAAVAEQLVIDVYPIPDYLITVLQSVRYHDNVQLVTCADGKTMTLDNFNFTARTTENDVCAIGQITAEINRVFLKGCQENKTTVA